MGWLAVGLFFGLPFVGLVPVAASVGIVAIMWCAYVFDW